MGVMEYAFATYVFLLLCTAIWLVSRLIRPRKQTKDQNSSYGKEQKLFNLYQNIEDLLAGFEEYVEETRAENERAAMQTAAMLEEAKQLCDEIKSLHGSNAVSEPVINQPSAQQKAPAPVPRASTAVKAAYKAAASIKPADTAQTAPDARIDGSDKTVSAAHAAPEDTGENKAAQSTKPIIQKLHMRLPDKVAELRKKGLEPSQIAQQLGISVREVSLAMKIRKAE